LGKLHISKINQGVNIVNIQARLKTNRALIYFVFKYYIRFRL